MYYSYYIHEVILWVYGITMVVFLLGLFFLPSFRDRKKPFLDTANLTALVVCLYALAVFVVESLRIRREMTVGEFIYSEMRWPFYTIWLLGLLLVPLLFIAGKLRRKVSFTILVMLAMFSCFYFSEIITLLSRLRGFDPPLNRGPGEGRSVSWYIIPATLVYFTLVYWLAGKRKRME